MIITLKNADFSKSNIGMLSTWSIVRSLGTGAKYAGPIYVNKDSAFNATVILDDGYEIGAAGVVVTMGGTVLDESYYSITGNIITFTIAMVTGNVVIKVSTLNVNTGEEDTGNPDDGTIDTGWYVDYLDQVAASGKDITGGTMFTGSSIAPVAFSDATNAKLVGKTISKIEIVPEKVGTIHFGTYNATTYAYTRKGSLTIAEADLNKRTIYDITPFTVAKGEYFTIYETGDEGCMSYYLASDLTGVEYDDGLKTKCDGKAPEAFNYQLTTLINIGGATSSSNGGTTTPTESTWYINSLTQAETAGTDFTTNRVELGASSEYAWAFQDSFNDKLAGQTINTIRLMVKSGGNFSVGVFDPSTNTITDKRNITIPSDIAEGTINTYKFNNLTIPSGKYFVWNCDYASGQAQGYYVLKDKLDPLAVQTCGWYMVRTTTGLDKFGSYELIFCSDIGYTV